MLKKLFGKKQESGGVALAMVVLKDAASVNPDRLAAALGKVASGPVEVDREKQLAISVPLGDAFAIVSLMPGPIPGPDLDAACRASWLWPGAAGALKGCKAHLIVVVMAPGDPVGAYVLLTRVVAAAVQGTGAPGVYWGNAGMVHEGAAFVEEAAGASRDSLPVGLWVRVNLSVDGGKCDGSTTGMEPLGHPEFEVHESARSPQEVGEILMMVSSYVLDQGPVLKHGQTFGRSQDERIPVRHGKSKWEKGRKVIVLGY